jgi:hypothetical protein
MPPNPPAAVEFGSNADCGADATAGVAVAADGWVPEALLNDALCIGVIGVEGVEMGGSELSAAGVAPAVEPFFVAAF